MTQHSNAHQNHPAAQRGTLRCGPFELSYSIEGSGAPALVIGSSIYYPRTFSAALRQELQLIFLDHRGFGTPIGEVNQSDYELDYILADIERFRQHLGLEQVIVVGHSGHGYMALEYAKQHPQHVSHVVLMATSPSHSDAHRELTEGHFAETVCPERKSKLDRDLRELPSELAAHPDKRFITFCLRLGARSWADPNFDATPLWEGVHVNMAGIDYLWGEVFRDLHIRHGLENFDIPVFLALGYLDYLVAPYFAWAPYHPHFRDLTVRIFESSSHTPQLEESENFEGELLRWLRRND